MRELFDQHPVFGQQPGVVQPDAVPQPFLDLRAVGARKLEPFERVGDGRFFLAGADVDAREILRALGRVELREMHDVDGAFAAGDKVFQRLRERRFAVGKLQRHGPVLRLHGDGGAAVEPGQFLLEKRRLAERGRHEQKARLRQRQQGDLPRNAPFAVGVVVELVHDDVRDVGERPLAQGDVGENFGGAAEDRRIAVHRGVAGAQADVLRAELAAQGEPFFVDERLDGAGVDRAFSLSQRLEMQGGGHEGFP